MEITLINENLVNQIRKDIFYLIKKSYNVKNIDTYNEIFSDIMGYVYLLDDLGVYCDDIFKYILPETRESTINKSIKEHFVECEKTTEFDDTFINNFADILVNSNYFHGNFEKMKKRINVDKMYEMTFDFFGNYKMSISNQLHNMLKEDRIVLLKNEFERYNGATVCSITKFSPYVIIYPFYNIIDPVTLIHEMGHVYHYQKIEQIRNRQYLKSVYSNQLEVYSHYLELLSYDYFSPTWNDFDILNLRRMIIRNLVGFYSGLESNLEFLNLIGYCENYDEVSTNYLYGRGMLLAFEFYDMYQNDKEKAEYNIERFISENGKYDFYTTIGKYDLNRERIESGEAVKKYIKQIF